jgi:polar amino acid transport system substrate-binding protein
VKLRPIAAVAAALLPASLFATSISPSAGAAVHTESHLAGGSAAPLFKDLPAAIQKSKVINVGTSVAYPPYDYNTASNSAVIGFEPDLRNAIAKELGVTFVNHIVTFDELIPGIQAGRFQIAMDGVSDTKAREAQVDFVDYGAAGAVILTLSSNAHKVSGLESLCGESVGGSEGTTAALEAAAIEKICTSAGKPADKPTLFPNVADVQLALKSGRIFAQMEDTATGGYDAVTSGGKISSVAVTGYNTGLFSRALFGIVVPKGQTQLAKALQAAFNSIIANGTYAQILKKWDISGLAVQKATIDTPSS